MQIDVYSHGFSVSELTVSTRGLVSRMCRLLGQMEYRPLPGGRSERYIARVYAGGTANHEIFWFLRGELDRFLAIVREYSVITPNITYHGVYVPRKVEHIQKDMREPRDYQIPAIEYVSSENQLKYDDPTLPGDVRLVTMGPGRGKTFVINRGIINMGVLTCFVIKPMYIAKWIADIEAAMEIKKGELIVVQGTAALLRVMDMAINNEVDFKILLISNATYRIYLAAYEAANGNKRLHGYPLNPIEFMQALGVGILAVDEVHQDHHFNYRLQLFSHVPNFDTLSGTIDPDNPFKAEMTDKQFPRKLRYVEDKPPPYIDAIALEYHLRNVEKVKWTPRGRPTYSHIAFEKSLMRNARMLRNYKEMVAQIVQNSYIPLYKPGYKMLLYFATKAMCTHIFDHLKALYPHLDVRRYNSGDDPYENCQEAEIIVTTLKSCGTAVDIKGLMVTLMTDALNDSQANLQALKRLRKPDEGDPMQPEFLYLVCRDIPRTVDYHEKKVNIFNGEVKTHQLLSTDFCI